MPHILKIKSELHYTYESDGTPPPDGVNVIGLLCINGEFITARCTILGNDTCLIYKNRAVTLYNYFPICWYIPKQLEDFAPLGSQKERNYFIK